MRAGELCIREVVIAYASESVVDAARRMADHRVGDVVVVEAPGDGAARPIGLVTDRDLVLRVLTRSDVLPRQLSLGEVMPPEVVTAKEQDDIESVLAKMRQHEIRRIPIVDQRGMLVGIVSLDDIVGWMSEQLEIATALIEHQTSA
jgi:CBS domain-containing protein